MAPRLEQRAGEYRSGTISRRIFLERLIAVLGSCSLAQHFLETSGWALSLLSPQESQAAGVHSTAVVYPGEGATLQGYWSRPQTGGPFPGVLLIHENRGLNEHIRDVARRIGAQGYGVLAVDQLSRKGGTAAFATPQDATAAFQTLTDDQVIGDMGAAYLYVTSHAAVRQARIGVMGFCWGGQRAFLYATANPNLSAAVVFYATPPPEEKLADIQCPVLGNYGETDTRITSTVPTVEAAMKEMGKSYDAKVYPGAAHAFFNDTNRERYNEEPAQDAWARSISFLKKNLG